MDDERWYCVSRDGLATLCLSEANAREMAADCDRDYPRQAPYRAARLGDVDAERDRCIAIIEAYRVPVGNSRAGELAAEWTLDALREVRDEIRKQPNARLTAPDTAHRSDDE